MSRFVNLSSINVLSLARELESVNQGYLQKIWFFENRCVMKIRDRNKTVFYLNFQKYPLRSEKSPILEGDSSVLKTVSDRMKNSRIIGIHQIDHDRIIDLIFERMNSKTLQNEQFLFRMKLFGQTSMILSDETRILWTNNKTIDRSVPLSFQDHLETSKIDSIFEGQTMKDLLGMSPERKELVQRIRDYIQSSSSREEYYLIYQNPRRFLFPFVPKGFRKEEEFSSFQDALKFLETGIVQEHTKQRSVTDQDVILEKKKRGLLRQRTKNLENVESCAKILNDLETYSEEIKTFLSRCERESEISQEFGETLIRFSATPTSHLLISTRDPQIKGWKYDENLNFYRLRDSLFQEKKSSVKATQVIDHKLSKEIQESSKRLATKVSLKHEVPKEQQQWYDREGYRIGITSGGFLVLIGRSVSSNEQLVSSHLEGNDIFCHAEFYGAPHVIIKNGKNASTKDREEGAKMAFLMTNRWRSSRSSGLSYWVYPNQVTKKDLKGRVVPEGQFYIHDPKNYVQISQRKIFINVIRYQNISRLMISVSRISDATKRILIEPSKQKTKLSQDLSIFFGVTADRIQSILPPGYSKRL